MAQVVYERDDGGLPEVVPDTSPQVLTPADAAHRGLNADDQSGKIPVLYDNAPKYSDTELSGGAALGKGGVAGPPAGAAREDIPDGGTRICGLRRRTFWIVLVVVGLVVLAAIIGGSVSGVMASRRQQAVEETPAPQDGGGLGATPTTSQVSSTSPSVPTQTVQIFLNNQSFTETGAALQVFSGRNYTGTATDLYRTPGFFDLPFNATSYVWLSNRSGCCITFCANTTEDVGFRCEARYQPSASQGFPRIYIWCGGSSSVEGKKCSLPGNGT